ncbi:MFS transporter [uncultured Endozoicomonas sp.]|uniref:MFS transporter n=1 Tax=uncultured Endozoicomonas sp. TaxID=432652 RepID=UPI002612F6E5|nr:MFS transporter [uncultured Endozoicomonas sp.]
MYLACRLRLVTTLSATLEFYDFTLLIFLASAISNNFFPSASSMGNIMPVLIVFFAGYIARFVGGFIYSHFGDRYGRKPYYMNSMVLMSLSTLGIALLPGFDTLGDLAPILLFCLRVLQGASLGGEIPGSVVYASEFSQNNRRGLVTGLIIFGVTFGNILASGVVWLIHQQFGEAAVNDWAWRLPFAAGSMIGLLSLWLRYKLTETPVFESLQQKPKTVVPIITLIKHYRLQLAQGVSLAAVPAVTVSVLFFMPRYLKEYAPQPFSWASISFFLFSALAISCFIFAVISDWTGRIPMIRLGAVLMTLVAPISIYFFSQGSIPTALAFIPLVISLAMVNGVYEASMVELFPTDARFSGVAFSHNLAFCLFGGATPLALEWLCSHGWLLAPGILPAVASFILLALSFNWRDRYQDQLAEV